LVDMREQHGPLKEQRAFGGNGRQSSKEQRFFGNYELVRRIDEGGMGEVYLARQRSAFGREVAVKIIRADLIHDVTVRKRFLREAEVSAHLKHEHILSLVEFGEDQGRLFLVTPYIDGGTLAQRLQSGPMSLAEVHSLFSALVRAVSYIHKRGVIHRDLKPGNVLLDKEEGGEQVYVRLIDFGIASIQGMEVAEPELTQSGKEVGTIEYMAPERLNGVAAPSNDIYSLGIILYQMLTGHLPGEGEPVQLPSPMAYVVNHCTARRLDERFPNGDELLRVFEQAYKAVVTPKVAPPTTTFDSESDETPRGVTGSQSVVQNANSAFATPIARPGSTFRGEDYNAPTSLVDPAYLPNSPRSSATRAGVTGQVARRPMRQERRKGSIFAFLSFAILALIAIISLVGYYAFVSAITATVTISPQVHSFTKVLTMTAKPALRSSDVATASIPASVLNSTQSGSQQGKTTGKQCIFGIFDCKNVVSFADVDPLAEQLRQSLRNQITADLTKQAHEANATTVGPITFTDGAPTPTPDVGSVSDTVTVTMKEQGAIEYFKGSDAQNLARTLLTQQAQQQFGPGYALLNSSTQIGQPAMQSVDANGVVTMQIAIGGVVQYNIASAQTNDILNHIKGTKAKATQSYLMHLSGINQDSVTVHVSYSDTLPSDTHQIKLVQNSPAAIPSVQLPPVKAALTPTL
jgi:serine/threonine protein kinase